LKFLRRKSNSPEKKAKDKADRALQDSYRRNYPKERCEVCGARFDVMHHHIEKSKSNYARFLQPANLVFLCTKCHSKLHFDYFNVASIYSLKRGQKWENKIKEIEKHPKVTLGINKFNEIKKYYDENVPEKWI
jgi:hypothetical protein